MAIGTSGSGRQTLTEINVTPLVDVMLVLLIVFMVTAPLIQQGVEVKLPEAQAKSIDAEEQKLVLSIRADRTIHLGADRTLPYGFVVEVMATVQRAGIQNLGMITNPAPERRRDARDKAQ